MTTPRASGDDYRSIPLNLIDDPDLPSRSEMDDAKMEELVASIRANGVLQNLVLVERGDRFAVVAGHRRSVAARRAGLLVVPAKVYPPDHPALRVIQAHENAKREDVNPVDEAFWFEELRVKDCAGDVERLAGLVGETLGYVLGRLELLELDEETREALRVGHIKIGVAKELRKCTTPLYRHYYLMLAIREGASIAAVCGWIQDWKRNIAEPAENAPPPPVPSVSSAPVSTYDPMQCYVCKRSDHRIPAQISVHTSCLEAVLDELLRGAANQQA